MKPYVLTNIFIRKRVRDIVTSVVVSASKVNDKSNLAKESFLALWDTGANISGITKVVADRINLKREPTIKLKDINGKEQDVSTFIVDFALPNGIVFSDLKICEVSPSHGTANVIIGMDIITLGSFLVEPCKEGLKFEFIIKNEEIK